MAKAYKNSEFMLGDDARPLRILSEYIDPRTRLAAYGVERAVIFWGSARLRPRGEGPVHPAVDYYNQARLLAARIVKWTMNTHTETQRYYICTGGGPGIMEAANRGAADVNQDLSLGLSISLPAEKGSNDYINKDLDFEFHYFFMRKFWFTNMAKALVVFPGGFGTMDELFEMLTLMQTDKHSRVPVVLYGRDFWERLIDFDVFVEHGLISPEDLSMFYVASDVQDAFQFLTRQMEPDKADAGAHPAA